MQLAGAQLAQPKLGLWELEVGGHRVGLHPQVFQLGYHLGREGGGLVAGLQPQTVHQVHLKLRRASFPACQRLSNFLT